MTDREAMRLALNALQEALKIDSLKDSRKFELVTAPKAMAVLRQALDHVPDPTKMTEPDMGIDRGAWADVPDATKWVDELRGGDETETEPVAWLDVDEYEAYSNSELDEEAKKDLTPLYTAPPKREWVGLTDEDEEQCSIKAGAMYRRYKYSIRNQSVSPADDYEWHLIRAIEAKLKEKNHD